MGSRGRRVPRPSSSPIPSQAVANILRGIGALTAGELAGERIAVAYETKDQEDEHSCFSDNTNADIVNNAIGIQNVYLGELPGRRPAARASRPRRRRSTPSSTPTLRAQLDEQRWRWPRRFPAPFDQLILGDDDDPGRAALLAALDRARGPGRARSPRLRTALGVKITSEV